MALLKAMTVPGTRPHFKRDDCRNLQYRGIGERAELFGLDRTHP
jgi:hypothetical protein